MSFHALVVLFVGLTTSAVSAQALVMHAVTGLPSGGDADGDGINDRIVRVSANYDVIGSATAQPIAYLNRPIVSFQSPAPYYFFADVNADGLDDLAYIAGSLQIVSGADGTTLLTLPASTSVMGNSDYDADGNMDLALREDLGGGNYRDSIRSGRDGSTMFQLTWSSSTTLSYDSLAWVGDADGDGYDDLGIANFNPVLFTSNLRLVSGATGAPLGQIGFEGTPIGDWNGDGTVVFSRYAARREFVDFRGIVTWASNGSGRSVGDLDGDGYDDAVVSSGSTNVFMSGATHAAMPGSVNLTTFGSLGDVDVDGRDEVINFINQQVLEWVDPAVPVASRARSRGASGTTSTGRKPRIKTRGHCGLGRIIFFDVRGAVPSGITFMVFGDLADTDLAPLGAPGNRAYVAAQASLLVATDARGLARYQLGVPNSATLLGARLSAQSAAFNPPANALGVVTSNAIDLEVH